MRSIILGIVGRLFYHKEEIDMENKYTDLELCLVATAAVLAAASVLYLLFGERRRYYKLPSRRGEERA